MSLRVTLDIFGDKQLDRELLRFDERFRNVKPVFTTIADDFLRIETRQFNTQGGYASGGWAPLQESTVLAKEAAGLDPRILHATLALRRSLTERGAPGAVRRITSSELVIGTNVKSRAGFPYPAAHQNPQHGQIRRRPIELRTTDRRRWVKDVQRYVVTGQLADGGRGL